ncbi:hypothetical protein YYE_04908 [Plasmodium vinckei vinckei]|uniref:Uncharacterized protein n=1 Tax=Plasmodium vinckei vinckei TaxID=54757 RepID=A0A081I982_PLAVN|nr:hypothetical protein YYE_04908 [Plasmodium vinckei vinckei]
MINFLLGKDNIFFSIMHKLSIYVIPYVIGSFINLKLSLINHKDIKLAYTVSLYLNNKTIATEPVPRNDKKSRSKVQYSTSKEIYEKNKHLLYTNPEE